jgi:uncharacterized protein (TIGR02996 family)
MTDHYDALLAAALENPADPGGWLILADWLEEQGNPAGEALRLLSRVRTMKFLSLHPFVDDIRRLCIVPTREARGSPDKIYFSIYTDEENRRTIAFLIGEKHPGYYWPAGLDENKYDFWQPLMILQKSLSRLEEDIATS